MPVNFLTIWNIVNYVDIKKRTSLGVGFVLYTKNMERPDIVQITTQGVHILKRMMPLSEKE
jgi:hypothetical protein